MRLKLLLLALLLPSLLPAETTPARPAAATKAPTLEDVIFDVRYLRQVLPPQAFISGVDPHPELQPEFVAAIKAAHLDEAFHLSPLPAGATPPKHGQTPAPHFPDERRHSGTTGKASFLLYVGADGKVTGLYCHEATDHVYAVAAAEALLSWKYKPAKIAGKPVPVLTGQLLIFESD